MAANLTTIRRPRLESFSATITLRDQAFCFRLYTRPLQLGPDLTVQYYWMNSSGFRINRQRPNPDMENLRNCVGHWWLAMQSLGLGRDPVQRRHLLLASSYPLIASTKSLQQVYRDAHLAMGATTPQDCSLPDSLRQRIQDVVHSRDRFRVQQELNQALGRTAAPEREESAMGQVFDGLLQHGLDLLQQHGNEGMYQFLGKLDAWLSKRRKKGGQGWLRSFLNRLAYECKISFYTCYANVWINLLPWLRQHRALDGISERFLRFWHMQNQPLELPDGRVIPDVFTGQVLSLHPLSGFFMQDAALCAIAGRFFGPEACQDALSKGQVQICSEYWNLVGAILSAAHLYRQALEEAGQRRGRRQYHTGETHPAAVVPAAQSESGLLEDFVLGRGIRCPRCRETVCLTGYQPAEPGTDHFEASFRCRVCSAELQQRIGREELRNWFFAQE